MTSNPSPRRLEFWLGPADPIRLEAFRIVLGLSLIVYMGTWWWHAEEWLTPKGFHLSSAAAQWYGPAAPLLPPAALPFFGLAFFGGLVAFVLGWRLKITGLWVFCAFTYVTYADSLSAFTLNRMAMAALAVLAVAPKEGSSYSARSVWPLRILQATIIIQYFTAGLCKIGQGDWLEDPNILWSQASGYYRTDLAAWMLRVLPLGAWSFMQYGALTFELLVPPLFMIRSWRPVGLIWGATFQVMSALMMDRLVYFSLVLCSFYVLFIDDSFLHRVRDRVQARLSRRPLEPAPATPEAPG